MESSAMSSPGSKSRTIDAQCQFASPPVDVLENKDEILVLVDVPGVKKDNLTIHVDKDQLTIEAERTTAPQQGSALATEYRPLPLRRRFAITQGSVDVDRITAELQNGVLRLTLPKPARMKPRVIKVTSG